MGNIPDRGMGAPKVKPGTVIAGRYKLVAPLSRGGMGSVWRAEHIALGSPIAVKLIDANLVEHDEPRARFEQEARAAAALRSPHVVQILDHGVDRNLPFIAMELLEGESLSARLHRQRKLAPAAVARVFQDVARAMKRAHDLGITHRDLKPDNIFLVKNDDLEIAKVLDFGIAKAQHPFGEWKGGTRTGALIGTPQYMSPEQAQGQPVDHRTDLWALGVIAFECLCGRLPFPSEKPGELILQICVHPIPAPSQIAAVPPRFDAWFARACHRDPQQRFQSAKELADALAEALGAAPASADVSGPFQAAPGSAALPAAPAPASPPVFNLPAAAAPVAPVPAAAPGYNPPPVAVATAPMGAPPPVYNASPGAPPAAPHPASPPVFNPPGLGLAAAPVPAPAPAFPNIPAPPPSAPHAVPAATAAQSLPQDVRRSFPRLDSEPTTLMALRGGGTMNGGAVMDSDPSTMVAIRSSRAKKLAAVGAVVALVAGLALWWGSGAEGSGSPAAPEAGASGLSAAPSSSAPPEAPGPTGTTSPAEPAVSASPSASASSSASAASSAPSSKPPVPGTTKPVRPASPKSSASPATSAGKKDPRIGW